MGFLEKFFPGLRDTDRFFESLARLDRQIADTYNLKPGEAPILRGVMKTIEHADERGYMKASDRPHITGLIRELQESGVSDEVIRQAIDSGNLERYGIDFPKRNERIV